MESIARGSRSQSSLWRWLGPPSQTTPEDTRRARALWMVAWPFLAVVTVTLAIAAGIEPATLWRRAVTVGMVAVLVVLLHEVSRRRRTMLACWMLVVGLTLLVTQRAWITGGIHAPVSVFYALFVMTAGGLLGARASTIIGILCFACACFLTGSELLGWLTAPSDAGPAAGSLVFATLAIGLALVLQNLLAPEGQRAARDKTLGSVEHDVWSFPTSGALETTDVSDMAGGVVSAMLALESNRTIEIIGDARVTCHCDAEVVRHVLETLVSNAIKHTPASGTVRLELQPLAKRVRIAVRDEGPGIPVDVRRRIFEPRSATPEPQSGYQPAGLSLALCKLAIESHGGTIRVEDVNPRGSLFIVELPR